LDGQDEGIGDAPPFNATVSVKPENGRAGDPNLISRGIEPEDWGAMRAGKDEANDHFAGSLQDVLRSHPGIRKSGSEGFVVSPDSIDCRIVSVEDDAGRIEVEAVFALRWLG
jgi:hypothetical protein